MDIYLRIQIKQTSKDFLDVLNYVEHFGLTLLYSIF